MDSHHQTHDTEQIYAELGKRLTVNERAISACSRYDAHRHKERIDSHGPREHDDDEPLETNDESNHRIRPEIQARYK